MSDFDARLFLTEDRVVSVRAPLLMTTRELRRIQAWFGLQFIIVDALPIETFADPLLLTFALL